MGHVAKNRRYCQEAQRDKLFFETEAAAQKFIEWNAEDMLQKTGYAPVRSYFCAACSGWHVTKHDNAEFYAERDKLCNDIAQAAITQGWENVRCHPSNRYGNGKRKHLNKSRVDLQKSIARNKSNKKRKYNKKKFGRRDSWMDEYC